MISTSYAKNSKSFPHDLFSSVIEKDSPLYDIMKTDVKGKLFIMDEDINNDGKMNYEDIKFTKYLDGDGDFRSEEVKKLRDEADIIITNPPFSLFREFVDWIMEANKQFLIIGNMNAITYKETFKYIKDNQMWVGIKGMGEDLLCIVPDFYKEWCIENTKEGSKYRYVNGEFRCRVSGIWFTNLEHNKRHQPMHFMTMEENLRHNKKDLPNGYEKYDNYDAIEVPKVSLIPSDYDGVMGVPITYLGNHNPEEFEIIWTTDRGGDGYLEEFKKSHNRYDAPVIKGKGLYKRIIIRKRNKK